MTQEDVQHLCDAFDRWGGTTWTVQDLEKQELRIADKDTHATDARQQNREWRASCSAVDGGQHLHQQESRRDYKAGQEKSTEKNDGAVTAIIALDRAECYCGKSRKSVYANRGIIVF